VVTVALDTDIEAARPFRDVAAPTHPSLVDPALLMVELFGITNVPFGIWVDETGTIVRPAEVAFAPRDPRAADKILAARSRTGASTIMPSTEAAPSPEFAIFLAQSISDCAARSARGRGRRGAAGALRGATPPRAAEGHRGDDEGHARHRPVRVGRA